MPGQLRPGQNFNCQRTLTMFSCTQLSLSLSQELHIYTVRLLEICQQSNRHTEQTLCVYKKENVGWGMMKGNEKDLAMAASSHKKERKRQLLLLLLLGESFFRSASVWFCEVSESFSCWVVLSLSMYIPSLFSIGKGFFFFSCTKAVGHLRLFLFHQTL